MDGRKNNGGNKNAGRKTKAEELKARTQILRAIKLIYGVETDEEAIDEHLKRFIETKEGMKFVSEHLLGKAPDKVVFTDEDGNTVRPMILFNGDEKSNNK